MLYANPISTTPSDVIAALASEIVPNADLDTWQSFEKDMGLTMAEFMRALPKAVQGVVTLTNTSILSFRVDSEAGTAFIICYPLANRQLGSLSLPRMKVKIELCDFNDAETEQFFNLFDLTFLRMGG